MFEPENMCQVFFYTDPTFTQQDIASMVLPAVPQVGWTVRLRMTATDKREIYKVVSVTLDIIRSPGAGRATYNIVVKPQ